VESITAIIQMAVVIMGSLCVLVGAGVGLYFYYTTTGQEEGE
jgi:hypothetical protein